MEAIYFYDKKIEKDINKILKNDEFMRISYIVRESNILKSKKEKEGYVLYIRASPEEINSLDQKITDIGAEKITGDEEIAAINTFKTEEENAASGMGMIFGGTVFS